MIPSDHERGWSAYLIEMMQKWQHTSSEMRLQKAWCFSSALLWITCAEEAKFCSMRTAEYPKGEIPTGQGTNSLAPLWLNHLGSRPSNLVTTGDEYSLGQGLQASMQLHDSKLLPHSWPQKLCEIINVYWYFHLLSFRVIFLCSKITEHGEWLTLGFLHADPEVEI
jgi:hypothetical protein